MAADNGIRRGFHAEQLVVLNSPREEVLMNTIQDLESTAKLAVLQLREELRRGSFSAQTDRPLAGARV